jgi:hypothetical protein
VIQFEAILLPQPILGFTSSLWAITVYHALANGTSRGAAPHYLTGDGPRWLAVKQDQPNLGVRTMKMIISTLVALSVLTGVAASASAFDAKTFFAQQDSQKY